MRALGILDECKLVDMSKNIDRALFIKCVNFANVTGTSVFAQGSEDEDIPLKASYDGINWFDLKDEDGDIVKVTTNEQGILILLVNIWIKADTSEATSTDLIVAMQ